MKAARWSSVSREPLGVDKVAEQVCYPTARLRAQQGFLTKL